MAGKNPAEAFEAFRRSLQQSLSCVTSAVLVRHTGARGTHEPDALVLGRRTVPVPLPGPRRLSLRVLIYYRVMESRRTRGSWDVETSGYFYTLEDRERNEILTYHWHPEGQGDIAFPHLHLGAKSVSADLAKAHIPSGQVAIEDVIRLAIADLEVEPIRDDWRKILGVNFSALRR